MSDRIAIGIALSSRGVLLGSMLRRDYACVVDRVQARASIGAASVGAPLFVHRRPAAMTRNNEGRV